MRRDGLPSRIRQIIASRLTAAERSGRSSSKWGTPRASRTPARELAVGEQHVVGAFVDGTAKLMLRGADDADGDERRGHRPPPGKFAGARRFDHPHGARNRCGNDEVDACQVPPVGKVRAYSACTSSAPCRFGLSRTAAAPRFAPKYRLPLQSLPCARFPNEFYGAPNPFNLFCWMGNHLANAKERCDYVAARPRQLGAKCHGGCRMFL